MSLPGDVTSLRRLFAFFRDSECYRDVSTTTLESQVWAQ